MPVGFAKGLCLDANRTNWEGSGPRPLSWAAWYPADDGAVETTVPEASWFWLKPVARDAALKPAARPHSLVLLSHGTGGVAAGLEWLAHRLAQRGFVALAVNHHGHTGAEPYRPEGFLCLWERASDISAMLDDRSWRRQLGGMISAHACVAGFSAGAYTAMLLMGARVAYSQFESANPIKSPHRGPREFPDLADHISPLLERSEVFRASWSRRSKDYSDPRFDAALVLAPGRSVLGFSAESLKRIAKPIRIVGGDADTIAPAQECCGWLHSHLPGAGLDILKGGVDHYVFVPEPTPQGRKLAPDIFTDADGIDRRSIHDEVASIAARFFGSVV
ncbi:alpha/beta hydrolase family protein [Rhizobium mongolense]|uniref:Dienelactone hydrolase n=2 Tax=Rhizobium mongolense TaxID=57676 RepID=A0ABR6IUW3_9HYPH|nr:hypothetical protein [Rhizobium mongolense]MBB4231568.1 putative dienelactone hydrolase [Rhizobium mongolense]TVZ64151.1 putative dienelactone hydrolase [Rhizobium mongolense USDA 1844]